MNIKGRHTSYREVFPGISVTNIFSALNVDKVVHEEFTAILNLSEFNYSNRIPPHIKYEWIELIDGAGCSPDLFIKAVDTLRDFRSQGHKTLVHCYAGVSRSASVAAVYMSKYQQQLLENLWEERKCMAPSHEFDYLHNFLEEESICHSEGFPISIQRDKNFQKIALAFRCMAPIRNCVYLRPQMWADLYPRIVPYLNDTKCDMAFT